MICTSTLILRGLNALVGLSFEGANRIIEFLRIWMHEALLPVGGVNTSEQQCAVSLCTHWEGKAHGQSTNSSIFFRGVIKGYYFCICLAGGCVLALLTELGLSPRELSKHLHWRAASVLFPSHALFSLLLLWFFCWVIPGHKTLPAYSRDGFGESHDPDVKP